MLNMDEPHEVNAAAGRFAGAIETVVGQVSATVEDLVLPRRPVSALDIALDAEREWAANTILHALATAAGGGEATRDQTTHTTTVLAAEDRAGGTQVHHRSDLI